MSGFFSEVQERNFRRANERVRRGGPDAEICGARTRTGSACQALPVKGSNRCIKHCGPKAAREHRERQRKMFLSGRLPAADWARAEAKRATNRLRERWKKDPWVPGSTIDLGEHESAFRAAAGLTSSGTSDPMPPAVLDWLRWRWRRLQVDRRRDREWFRTLQEEIPRRLSAAGPAPDMDREPGRAAPEGAPMKWKTDMPEQFSKRSDLDQPRAPVRKPVRSVRGRGRPRARPAKRSPDEQADIAMFVHTYRETLAPLFERCRADEQMQVVEALRAFVADPDNPAARDRWMHVFLTLNSR